MNTNDKGNFEFKLPLTSKKPIRLTYNSSNDPDNPNPIVFVLWIESGKELTLTIKNDSTIEYSGGCILENNLLKKLKLNSYTPTEIFDTTQFNFRQYQNLLETKATANEKILNNYITKNKPSKEFMDYVKAELLYVKYSNYMQYASVYSSLKNIPYTELNKNNEFRHFINSVNLQSDRAFYSLKFRNFLWKYFDYISTLTLKKNENYTLHTFRLIDKKLPNHNQTKEWLKSYLLKFTFSFEQNIDSLRQSISSIEQNNPQSKSLAFFNSRLNEKINLLYSQKSLPDILLTDTSGRKIALKDFAGKILFVDFWGSWCKPCMEEMPFSKKLHEELDSEQIVFIYINNPTDSDNKWKETLKKLNLKGINLKATEESQKKLTDFYAFTGYPFYVIHDKSGKPLNVEGGIRPSTNARQILTSLIDSERNSH